MRVALNWLLSYSNHPISLPPSDISKWRNAFDTYDMDHDGFISPADLQKNPNLSLQKVQLLKGLSFDQNWSFNFNCNFSQFLFPHLPHHINCYHLSSSFSSPFSHAEADCDNNNLIDFGEFVAAISSLDVVDLRRTFEGFDSVDIQMEFEKFAAQVYMSHCYSMLSQAVDQAGSRITRAGCRITQAGSRNRCIDLSGLFVFWNNCCSLRRLIWWSYNSHWVRPHDISIFCVSQISFQNEEGTRKVMNIPQLKRLMCYCDCICVTDKDAERLLKDMDMGGDGVVDFEEFKTVSRELEVGR